MRTTFPVTVHLLFFREGKVLLARRHNTGYMDGHYSVPAGHLDGGETVTQAALREAREEIGLDLDPAEVRFACVLHRFEDEERIDFFVRVTRWSGEPLNAEPEKCDDLRWFRLSTLPEDIIPYVHQGITNSLTEVPFGEFGWEA
ncbi:MAG: NUDIX domain-containing protein [Anaerolineales bacterium]|nr:NUDIX domain-containing protein [Anaerolineales bacterium]